MLTPGEGYLKNLQKALNQRPWHQPGTSSLALSVSSLAEDPEWYICFTNIQQTLNQRPQYPSFSGLSRESSVNILLCNNKANLLTWLITRCQKILGTGPRMTGAGDDSSLPTSTFPLLFFNKNSIPFNTLFLLGCVKITTVIFTHFEQTSENTYKSAKNIVIIKSYCKNRQPLLNCKK